MSSIKDEIKDEMRKLMKNRCIQKKKVEVLQSAAGFYIGTVDEEGPYCRLSEGYYKTAELAQIALDNRTFIEREGSEIMFCNGTHRKCLI